MAVGYMHRYTHAIKNENVRLRSQKKMIEKRVRRRLLLGSVKLVRATT